MSTIVRRLGLVTGLLIASAIAWTQIGATLAAPMPKVGFLYHTSGGAGVGSGSYSRIADMDVPAGKYHVTARGLISNQTGASVDYVSCNAYAGNNAFVDAGTDSAPLLYGAFSIDGTADLPSGGTIWVECISPVLTAPFPSVGVSLSAESVAGIVALP
jgi:hypothetical protein